MRSRPGRGRGGARPLPGRAPGSALAVAVLIALGLWQGAPATAEPANATSPEGSAMLGLSDAGGTEAVANAQPMRRISLPAAGHALRPRVPVRRRPRTSARRIAVMRQFRYDFRPTVFFAIARRVTRRGEWLRVHVPGRPNGRRGWARAAHVELDGHVGRLRIVVDLGARRLRLRRGSRTVLSAPVAIGRRGAPTPTGRFYVTAAFRPSDSFLGPWAFETSAYAAITDWPRGGIVGLHGTSAPSLIGGRVSTGCIRVRNSTIQALRRRVAPGTPIRIRP